MNQQKKEKNAKNDVQIFRLLFVLGAFVLVFTALQQPDRLHTSAGIYQSAAAGSDVTASSTVCSSGSSDPRCLDKCSTSYSFMINEGGKKVQKVSACVFNKGIDPVGKAIQKVVDNCQTNGFNDVWAKIGCKENPAKVLKNGNVQKATGGGGKALFPPQNGKEQVCKQSLKKLKSVVQKSLSDAKKGKASGGADTCEYHGAVTCIQDSNVSDKFICKPKNTRRPDGPPAPQPPPAPLPPPSPGRGGFGDAFNGAFGQNFAQSMMCAMQTKLGIPSMNPQCMMMQMMQRQQGQGQGNRQERHPCESYYYRIFHPKTCSAPKDAVCLLVVSKNSVAKGEPVRVKWRVAETVQHSLTFDTALGVNQRPTEKEGEITIYPKASGAISLTGTGRGEDNTCSKRVSITVSGSTGTGDYPPTVSCTPSTFSPQNPVPITVRWSCTGGEPDHAEGVGFSATATQGSARVSVQQTQTFGVRCYHGNTFLGSNSCTVRAEQSLFDVIAYPASVKVGERARITWGSLNMTTCRVTGPHDFSYEAANAVVVTTPFAEGDTNDTAIYTVECASKYGGSYTKEVHIDKID